MKGRILAASALLLLSVSERAAAQTWEVGVGGGGSFYTSKTVTAGRVTGDAKLGNGWMLTGYLGNNVSERWGGEIRYAYQQNDLQLQSGGTTVNFGARSHAIHYDFLFHATKREARVRPFVAFGAGFKGYQGTGREVPVQPLSNLAFLTRTNDWKPLISVGGGVKFRLGKNGMIRAEIKDYITQVPTNLIAPAPGAKLSGWFHNFVAMFGVGWVF